MTSPPNMASLIAVLPHHVKVFELTGLMMGEHTPLSPTHALEGCSDEEDDEDGEDDRGSAAEAFDGVHWLHHARTGCPCLYFVRLVYNFEVTETVVLSAHLVACRAGALVQPTTNLRLKLETSSMS
jgi:hypothetical protein